VDDDKDDTGFSWITPATNNGLYIWDDDIGSMTVSNGSTWESISIADNNIGDCVTVTNNNGLQITGEDGPWDLEDRIKTIEKVVGWDLEDRIKTIEKVVGIPTRDYNLEEKHPHLKDMFDEHIKKIGKVLHSSEEYEAECEKLRTWETISKENGSSKT